MLPPAAAAIAPAAVLLREVLAVSLTGIIFYTPIYGAAGAGEIVDFTFEYLNPAAQRLLRLPEVPAVTHNQQWPHSVAHGAFQFHVDAFVSSEPREYNINYPADGGDTYYRLAARRAGEGLLVSFAATADQPRPPAEAALQDAQGQITGDHNLSSDVTDAMRARQQVEQLNQEWEARVRERTAALQESEARFRIMADAAPNQVWAVNPDGTIRYANQAFLDFVGVNLEQYVATGWASYLHPQELDVARRTLAEAIQARALYVLEHRMRRHDGQYRWLLSQGAPSFYPNGDLYGYVGSAIDITELKQTNERLTRTNQDLDNFVYAASHDLKQPVNNLAGLFEEVRRSSTFASADEEQLLVPMVQEALLQLGMTIDDLAALGQAQQTSEAAPVGEVPLAELLEEVVNSLEPQVRAARARITADFGARAAVAFARANLRTVLHNLLSNSLKYADPARPARIHVSVWVEEGQPVLVVQDNGLGFDADKHGAELFHLFRRLHSHTPGSGVGLYLVNRIVQAHGGSIAVDSQPGAGATFRVRLGGA